jgi:hypothetical protein
MQGEDTEQRSLWKRLAVHTAEQLQVTMHQIQLSIV